MPVRSAISYSGDVVEGFPIGGRVRSVDVGAGWVDLMEASEADLILVRVPQGSRRILLRASTDILTGSQPSMLEARTSWILDPGVWQLCTDRDRDTGPRFWLAIDPSDGSPNAQVAELRVMEAAS